MPFEGTAAGAAPARALRRAGKEQHQVRRRPGAHEEDDRRDRGRPRLCACGPGGHARGRGFQGGAGAKGAAGLRRPSVEGDRHERARTVPEDAHPL